MKQQDSPRKLWERSWALGFRVLSCCLFILSMLGTVFSTTAVIRSIVEFKAIGGFGVVISVLGLIGSTLLALVGWFGMKIRTFAQLDAQNVAFPRLGQIIRRWGIR